MTNKIYTVYVSTESGDEYTIGAWMDKPTEQQIATKVVEKLVHEVTWWVEEAGYDIEWAKQNPIEALEISLLYPQLNETTLYE